MVVVVGSHSDLSLAALLPVHPLVSTPRTPDVRLALAAIPSRGVCSQLVKLLRSDRVPEAHH